MYSTCRLPRLNLVLVMKLLRSGRVMLLGVSLLVDAMTAM